VTPASGPACDLPPAEAHLQGTLSGLLGNDLERLASAGVPLSRDVLSLESAPLPAVAQVPAAVPDVLAGFAEQGPRINSDALGLRETTSGSMAAALAHAQTLNPAMTNPTTPPPLTTVSPDVLGRWETTVDLTPDALGRVDLSSNPVAARSIDNPFIAGDREAYQQRYQAVGDILELGSPSLDVASSLRDMHDVSLERTPDAPAVSLQSGETPPQSETRRLDRLVSMMARGVDVGKVDNPLLAASQTVVSHATIQGLSQEPYSAAGTMGLSPTLSGTTQDPAGPLSEHLRGNLS